MEVIWRPSAETLERAHLTRLMRAHGIERYPELLRRSQEEPEWFWPAVVDDLGLELFEPWRELVDRSGGPEWTTWFRGAKLNVAWNCVHRWAQGEHATNRRYVARPRHAHG